MRGSPCVTISNSAVPRIIPAHAGLTARRDASRIPSWDHPRACGAHTARAFIDYLISGSSPRMRGSRLGWLLDVPPQGSSPRMRGSLDTNQPEQQAFGIIPAHAGLTRYAEAPAAIYRDHPRACGAHVQGAWEAASAWGSSPRMRGSQWIARVRRNKNGIIPAHAGLTTIFCARPADERDHPRACGAH